MSDQQTVVNVNLTAPMATGVLPVAPKSTGAAFVFWFFLGTFGAHRFYLNRPSRQDDAHLEPSRVGYGPSYSSALPF